MYLFFEKQLDVSELTNTHHLNYTTSLVEALRLRIRNNRHSLYITIFYYTWIEYATQVIAFNFLRIFYTKVNVIIYVRRDSKGRFHILKKKK